MQAEMNNNTGLFTVTGWLFRQVNIAPLIAFRIMFGFLLMLHSISTITNGTVYQHFVSPPFTFTFIGFEFLHALAGPGMYWYVSAMAVLAALIMIGAWYRFAMVGYALMWTILYLMQKAGYNNHYYLVLLLCWLMAFMPANRNYSVDAKRGAVQVAATCPQYCIGLFIFQVFVMYFFAAISKLTPDWFSGKFIAIQFSRLSQHPQLGYVYGDEWFQWFICYAGFFFDLLIVPLLFMKRTRAFAFFLSCCFHLFNSFTFKLGIFPYLSLALSVFFFEASVVNRIFFRKKPVMAHTGPGTVFYAGRTRLVAGCLFVYVFFQLLLPVRYLLFPGNVFWTEEGYRMSWKMMLRTKSGNLYFKVYDPERSITWKVEPSRIFSLSHMRTLSTSPDIIWQYAQTIKKGFENKGYQRVQVFAIGTVSLNRNPAQPLVDSTVDLASVKWHPFRHSPWITDYPH